MVLMAAVRRLFPEPSSMVAHNTAVKDEEVNRKKNNNANLFHSDMSPPSSVDAATGPETVQAPLPAPASDPIDSADPCHTHSRDFLDCLNNHEIKLGKCMHHLGLLHQCRRRADDDVMKHSEVQEGGYYCPCCYNRNDADSCYIPYQALKNCLNKDKDEVVLGKCELHLHSLFVCHTRARELFS